MLARNLALSLCAALGIAACSKDVPPPNIAFAPWDEAWRSKLQQEQTRREWEQKIAEAQKAEEERLKKAQKGNRITGSFKAITGEFPKPNTGQQKAVTAPIPPQGGKPADSPSGLFQKIGSLFGKKDK